MEEKLIKKQLGGLPLLNAIVNRTRLRSLLHDVFPAHGNEKISTADTALLLVYNLALGKEPLYKIPDWANSIDLNSIGLGNMDKSALNDDRFGKALDKIYSIDKGALLVEFILNVQKEFDVASDQIHNDSTTVTAYGHLPGKTKSGLEFRRGHSKDHRPDLKQLVFNLTVSNDGAVPIHYQCYSGNRTDDTIHKETWTALCHLLGKRDFLYVADSKLCTDDQLTYIAAQGGRALSIMPQTWGETKEFRQTLQRTTKKKKEIWRRMKPGSCDQHEYFSSYNGNYLTKKRGYKIHWIFSSEKKRRDKVNRLARIEKAENQLLNLRLKINRRHLKTEEAIEQAVKMILSENKVVGMIDFKINPVEERSKKQIGLGRPTKKTKYETIITHLYTLSFHQNKQAIKIDSKIDGAFPLLCTDPSLSALECLKAYKYQPRLEKRFQQLKSVHEVAPIYFKSITRVEANMLLFFIALVIQALLEREIRLKMVEREIEAIDIYPEDREAKFPTTNSIMSAFEKNYRYELIDEEGDILRRYFDELKASHVKVLNLLDLTEEEYWKQKIKTCEKSKIILD